MRRIEPFCVDHQYRGIGIPRVLSEPTPQPHCVRIHRVPDPKLARATRLPILQLHTVSGSNSKPVVMVPD
jgi:hypothetical protein